MNVYDFDKTIYDGDSTIDFYLFSLKKNIFIIKYLPKQVYYYVLYILGIKTKEEFKESFFCFIKSIKNVDDIVNLFWKKNKRKIKKFYYNIKKSNDVIISASPSFLLKPICDELNIDLIATNIEINTRRLIGKNCYGEEKLVRFKEKYKNKVIDKFYTDSLSDIPLLENAKEGFIVSGSNITPYLKYKEPLISKIKGMFLKKEFIRFLFVGVINAFNGVILSTIFSIVFGDIFSFIVGYLVSLIISYFLNSYIVFEDKKLKIKKFFKFCISYIPNFLVQLFCVFILIKVFNVYKIITYIVSICIGVPITYILLYCFTYNKKSVVKK